MAWVSLSSSNPFIGQSVLLYRRLPRRSDATTAHHVSGSVATTTTATAGDAGDDDVEDGDDAVDDGGQHGADAIDNGHQAVADGAEDGFKLEFEVSGWTSRVCVEVNFGASVRNLRKRRRHPF
jgi:hypothetical protein